jgi:hypothetical protein
MTYAQYGKIEATDYNTLVGTSPSSTANQLNTVWATGTSKNGYGQTAVPQVTAGQSITAAAWASVINKTSNVALHQGTAITAIAAPVSGGTISYLSALPTNIQNIYAGKNNAAAQGSTSTTSTTNPATWYNGVTFTHTITFASGDAARYFFNAGGQIQLTFSHPSGSGINSLFNALGSAAGTLVLSSPNTGTVSVSGTAFNGFSKIGGSGTPTTLLPNVGYYGLSTSDQEIFKQYASGSPAGYVSSYLSINAKTNGSQGSNSDNGSTITITSLWKEVPTGLTVASGTTTAVTIKPPASTYITNTWGSITVIGSVAGS